MVCIQKTNKRNQKDIKGDNNPLKLKQKRAKKKASASKLSTLGVTVMTLLTRNGAVNDIRDESA